MKRRVLCIFVLILWGLVFCTMLSVRIEQLMIPEVVLTQADESEPSPHIALDSLFFDDTGIWRSHGTWIKASRTPPICFPTTTPTSAVYASALRN